jgi:hypothetical protein
MYRRKRNREKMVLAVRVSGKTADGKVFDELTHTIDIAVSGGRLGGMQRLQLRTGDLIEVRRNGRKGTFRIVWIGKAGGQRYGHVGIQAVRMPPNFWGLELPQHGEAPLSVNGPQNGEKAAAAS